nr:putative reverse transcriptase domain-containing protein [Tanacetum cinerariifolium]
MVITSSKLCHGLLNAPVVFMDLMNRVCKPYLDKFVIVFIDNILTYLRNKKEHEEHIKAILEFLKKEELYAKFSKCKFWIPKASPKSPTEIHQFLGLTGYYQRFIEGFLKITKSMTKLTQKGVKFDWGDKEEADFQLIKKKLRSAPIMSLPEGSDDFVAYFARNTIVKFECIDARVKFDVSNENDDFSYFMFVKVFSLLSAESEDTIFNP